MSIFTEVELPKIPSNSFNLSHDHKLSTRMGVLTPINCMEMIPGDKITGSTTLMMRMLPILAPIMHEVNVDLHHFFIPNRIIWPNWEKFITAGVPNETTPAHPYLAEIFIDESSLGNKLGLPITEGAGGIDKVSALPFAAYQKVWFDYYRDQNLQPQEFVPLVDGLNDLATYQSQKYRAWQHDYFTSALPFAQKGDPVAIPLSGTATLLYDAVLGETRLDKRTGDETWTTGAALGAAPNGGVGSTTSMIADPADLINVDVSDNHIVNLNDATAVTINALRWAVRLQEFLERNARGGTRYIENILAHFGVRSSDKRLQRPEFLGGSSAPMVISEVLQNAPATAEAETPQGNMAGHGLSIGRSKNINYFVEEHGIFITVMSVRPKTAYQQGIPRMFSKFDPLQYAWPTFANVGEQAILNREIYYSNVDPELNDATFGYIPRYAEYKYQPSKVSGYFATSLNFWHLGRIFESRPALNAQFIGCDPTDRIFAVQDGSDNLLAHAMNNINIRRRLPRFGIPTL